MPPKIPRPKMLKVDQEKLLSKPKWIFGLGYFIIFISLTSAALVTQIENPTLPITFGPWFPFLFYFIPNSFFRLFTYLTREGESYILVYTEAVQLFSSLLFCAAVSTHIPEYFLEICLMVTMDMFACWFYFGAFHKFRLRYGKSWRKSISKIFLGGTVLPMKESGIVDLIIYTVTDAYFGILLLKAFLQLPSLTDYFELAFRGIYIAKMVFRVTQLACASHLVVKLDQDVAPPAKSNS